MTANTQWYAETQARKAARNTLFCKIELDERENYRAVLSNKAGDVVLMTEYCASKGIVLAEADNWRKAHPEYTHYEHR